MERNCDNCKYRDVYYMAPPCDECNFEYQRQPQKGFQNWESNAMTNADRIRSMTDEELAEFLFHAWNNASWCSMKECPDEDSCLPCWLDWLKEEAECGGM